MTTLRSFQNEIEEIHNREVSKQRAQAVLEKEHKSAKGKVKEEGPAASGSVKSEELERQGSQDPEEEILVCC
jgi:hypothetical protein